jgi:hypothetical protein
MRAQITASASIKEANMALSAFKTGCEHACSIALFAVFFASPAVSQQKAVSQDSPQRIIQGVYACVPGGCNIDYRRLPWQMRTKALVQKMIARTKVEGEEFSLSCIEADPATASQDPSYTRFTSSKVFENSAFSQYDVKMITDGPQTSEINVSLLLAKENERWWIEDIISTQEGFARSFVQGLKSCLSK